MGMFKKIWDKTVFSDMVANSKKKKEEDNAIKAEAVAEAEAEIKPLKKEIIKEQYKEQELNRIKKNQKSFAEKLSAGFGGSDSIGQLASDEKLDRMLGNDRVNKKITYVNQDGSELGNTDFLDSDRKINMIMGKPLNTDKTHFMTEDSDKTDKIKMLYDEKDRSEKLKRMVK